MPIWFTGISFYLTEVGHVPRTTRKSTTKENKKANIRININKTVSSDIIEIVM
jgi:hypothetical protein